MPMPRCRLVSLEATPYYHVISRCVRRQFLCGVDRESGRDFTHRRGWIRKRIFKLQGIFAVDICAYAVMSNHLHLVVRMDQERAAKWSDEEVAERWLQLFGGNPLVRSFLSGSESLSRAQQAVVDKEIDKYRNRLFDLSWFMRCLNEPIARWANAEDNVTGRFWEGRFKSQALLDEAAVIAAMTYVDLNPVRAGMAETPETSDYTSIQQRIVEQDGALANLKKDDETEIPKDLRCAIGRLMAFSDQNAPDCAESLPYSLTDYLELVDWSGRAIVAGKRGSISETQPPILERLKIDQRQFLKFVRRHDAPRFHGAIGAVESLRSAAEQLGKRFLKGQSAATRVFGTG
ncbi:transposase [Wenzhouxiangella sp. XN79A]|uniref:transposase n=1 Tax=Wenzhouxiangella sp. XN79A TaxID=2724193 RepID=UPI00144AC079|nr:transposase [Wenzhouxiangella sp. XN79A]NKI36283.1 transposase [Wenzhouxiangella sp. XN79A]